jgi:hypothetical protein
LNFPKNACLVLKMHVYECKLIYKFIINDKVGSFN